MITHLIIKSVYQYAIDYKKKTYFMSQQFSVALINEFVETDNSELQENIYFQSNASKFEILLSTNFLLTQL